MESNEYDKFIKEWNKMSNESISELINKPLAEEDLNNFCHYFLELLELSFAMQWKLYKQADSTGSKEMEIFSEGCDNLIKRYHKGFLELKKKYDWDSNIGEELISLKEQK